MVANTQRAAQIIVRAGLKPVLGYGMGVNEEGFGEMTPCLMIWHLSQLNLALCCKSCNIRKSDHISGIDPESREETVLFDPRQDAWNEHFDFDAGRFQLLGTTPTGRATINQLKMNTSYQIQARKYWVEAGLYP